MRHDETGLIQFQFGVQVGNVAIIELKLAAGGTRTGRSAVGKAE